MSKIFIIASAILLLPLSAQAAVDTACVAVEKHEISALFERWNTSLHTGDPARVADNYSPDAVLLPTLSNIPRLDREGRLDYFTTFLAKKPSGSIDSRTIQLGCNSATDTGVYTFTFNGQSPVVARYTFTYAWTGRQWLINSHHSSAMPES